MKKNNKYSPNKHCTYYIDGMHCASCEILIEKKILKENLAEVVDASLSNNRVEITYRDGHKPDINKLNDLFNKNGYNFSEKKIEKKSEKLFLTRNGKLLVNTKVLLNRVFISVALLVLIATFFVFERMQLGQYVSVDSNSALPMFLLLGVVAGLSSCAALIGGLLLSMIKQWNELYIDEDSSFSKSQPHIFFHSGRLIAFAIFGGILGLIGESLPLDNTYVLAVLTILVSTMMFFLALQMLGVGWAQRIKLALPKSITSVAADEQNFSGKNMPFILGMVTFFLPCGFTLIAQTIALASGSFISGALIMLMFALGTLPVLIGISIGGLAMNSKPHLTAKFNLIAGFVVLFFVIYNVNGQMNVLGLPSLSDINFKSNTNNEELVVADANGQQTLNITAMGFSYLPTGSMTIKSGVPTKLVVDNKGIQGCGSFMAATGLIDNFVSLKPGINTIDLGKPAKGTYKLTCSMGMVAPVTITVI